MNNYQKIILRAWCRVFDALYDLTSNLEIGLDMSKPDQEKFALDLRRHRRVLESIHFDLNKAAKEMGE